MRNATPAFMRALAEGRRDYVNRLAITLADGTVLQGTETTYDVDTGTETVTTTNYLTNENLWEDGMKMEDSVSADDVFQIGAAIINSATFTLNNIDDRFSPYSFDGARCIWTVGLADLDDGTSDFMQMGTFVVDETDYDGSVITLKCLDNMSKFDKPYNTTLVYPATLGAIVRDACTKCGVTLATNSLQFPHYTYEVTNKPSSESTTYRQVISWAAQIAVCFARCNAEGQLEFKFYNTSALDTADEDLDGGTFDSGSPSYTSGDTADGGSFNPWNTGSEEDGGDFTVYPQMHFISSAFSQKISTDDVVITGVKIQKKIESDSSSDAYETYTYGTDGYIVSIEGNDFIDGTHGEDVKNWMGTALVGLVFRKAEVQHPNDPTFEAGDVAYYWDRKGNRYTLLVSSTTFSCNSSQRTVSAAETPAKNSAQKFTESTRNYVEMRKQMAQQKTAWETAAEGLADRINRAGGLYETDVTVGSATQRWLHDKPNLSDSEIVIAVTTAGVTVCADYKTKTDAGETPTWYGLIVDGTFIAGIINTISLFFDNAHGGTLTLGGDNNTNGQIVIKDASDQNIGSWSNSGLSLNKGIIRGTNITIGGIGNTAPTFSVLNQNGIEFVKFANNNVSFGQSTGQKVSLSGGNIGVFLDDIQKGWIQGIGVDAPYLSEDEEGVAIIGEEAAYLFSNNGSQWARVDSTGFDASIKHRMIKGTPYGDILLTCFETATPYFGDMGTGRIGDDGMVVVSIDDVFIEAVDTNVEYCVFLQKEGIGDCWVFEKDPTYFVVEGTPGLRFSWEIKAVQKGFEHNRLDDHKELLFVNDMGRDDLSEIFDQELEQMDNEDLFG